MKLLLAMAFLASVTLAATTYDSLARGGSVLGVDRDSLLTIAEQEQRQKAKAKRKKQKNTVSTNDDRS